MTNAEAQRRRVATRLSRRAGTTKCRFREESYLPQPCSAQSTEKLHKTRHGFLCPHNQIGVCGLIVGEIFSLVWPAFFTEGQFFSKYSLALRMETFRKTMRCSLFPQPAVPRRCRDGQSSSFLCPAHYLTAMPHAASTAWYTRRSVIRSS